jgi:hypothetical protein
MTTEELKEYYADLLIAQYRNKIKARATIGMLAQELSGDVLFLQIRDAFNLETAVGNQLDIIGKIVGVERNIYGLDLTNSFFEFTTYTSSPVGTDLQIYTDASPGPELISRYRVAATYAMPDFDFRALIKMKIISNTARRSLKEVKEGLYAAFSGGVDVVDNANMFIDFNVQQPYYNMMVVATYINILPRPTGVIATVNYI